MIGSVFVEKVEPFFGADDVEDDMEDAQRPEEDLDELEKELFSPATKQRRRLKRKTSEA